MEKEVQPEVEEVLERREFLRHGGRAAAAVALCGAAGLAVREASSDDQVWQIDPDLCVKCGLCATNCVLELSAVKCVHTHAMCGYCTLCFGFFLPDADVLGSAAENQVCPTNAFKRRFVEEPYFEYTIDEPLCVGCAKCVEGCNTFGNGSLHLQIRHDRCLNCNECAIATGCPADAFVRLPASKPYLFRGRPSAGEEEEQVWIAPTPGCKGGDHG